MNNYDFCIQWVLDKNVSSAIRVLDYGCGTGKIVEGLRRHGVNSFGCDIFYEGGDRSQFVNPNLFGDIIKKMTDEKIPFDDGTFDYIINNQVMEHVEDLSSVLAEIHRVLKPDGMVLSLFPDKGVWREGHCGVPFLHWFSKGSGARVYYAAAFRAFGLGYHKGNKSIIQWSREFCEYLDKWTHYKEQEDIHSAYRKYSVELQHIEDYWLQQRLEKRKILVGWSPVFLQRLVVRKLGGLVFTACKRPGASRVG